MLIKNVAIVTLILGSVIGSLEVLSMKIGKNEWPAILGCPFDLSMVSMTTLRISVGFALGSLISYLNP